MSWKTSCGNVAETGIPGWKKRAGAGLIVQVVKSSSKGLTNEASKQGSQSVDCQRQGGTGKTNRLEYYAVDLWSGTGQSGCHAGHFFWKKPNDIMHLMKPRLKVLKIIWKTAARDLFQQHQGLRTCWIWTRTSRCISFSVWKTCFSYTIFWSLT